MQGLYKALVSIIWDWTAFGSWSPGCGADCICAVATSGSACRNSSGYLIRWSHRRRLRGLMTFIACLRIRSFVPASLMLRRSVKLTNSYVDSIAAMAKFCYASPTCILCLYPLQSILFDLTRELLFVSMSWCNWVTEGRQRQSRCDRQQDTRGEDEHQCDDADGAAGVGA